MASAAPTADNAKVSVEYGSGAIGNISSEMRRILRGMSITSISTRSSTAWCCAWQSGHIRHFIVTYKPVFCRRIGRVMRVWNWIAASGSLIDGYRCAQPILRELKTGRTHQIRVHLGFPIAGDDKYGDFARNKALMKQGLKRMFLH